MSVDRVGGSGAKGSAPGGRGAWLGDAGSSPRGEGRWANLESCEHQQRMSSNS